MSEDVFDNDYGDYNADSADSSGLYSNELKQVLDAIDVSNSLTTPLKNAIDEILNLAARAVGSEVASILVRDGNEGGLKFLTAISDVKEELLKLHIPPGKGIAGLVFGSGQPMAVSDVSNEGSFWSEADKKTGFKTITLLATPLRTGNEMVGVLEFINRTGDPPYPPFTPEEMDHEFEERFQVSHHLFRRPFFSKRGKVPDIQKHHANAATLTSQVRFQRHQLFHYDRRNIFTEGTTYPVSFLDHFKRVHALFS